MDDDVSDADLGRVLTLVQRSGLRSGPAEDLTLDIVRRHRRGAGPAWLSRAAPRTRLDVLTVLAVLRARG